MNIRDTYKHLSEIDVKRVEDRAVLSNVSLKKMVKPKTRFLEEQGSTIWFYIGHRYDYVVVPRVFCSCKDFLINVMSRKRKKACRHLMIQRIAEETGSYRTVEISDPSILYKIINEILNINISPTLRKLLHSGKGGSRWVGGGRSTRR